jgi:Domain of unknown function (DUF4361)
MKKKFIYLFVSASLLLFASCKKVLVSEDGGDKGQTIVKLHDGLADTASGYAAGYKLLNIDLVSTPQTLEMVDVRRDAANSNELNKAMNIIVKNDQGAVTTYNSSLVPLPAGSFTVDASTPLVGNDYTVALEPGNIGKVIKITITNAQNLNLNNSYGMGFTISSVDANGKIAGLEKTIVVEIGLKNIYDGIYSLRGYVLRATDATSSGAVGPKEISLVTTSSNSVRYSQSHGWANTATIGIAATVGFPTFTVNSDNTVATSSDGGAFPAGLTNIVLPGIVSRYIPSSKTFYAYSTWGGGIGVREMRDTLVYLRPR